MYDSYSDDSDFSSSDIESRFFYGYCEPLKKKKGCVSGYLSLRTLKNEYTGDMEMDKKILLFIQAAEDDDIEFMERLMFDNVHADCIGRDGWTALMKACLNGRVSVVEFLLQCGSNVNFQADLYTPLMACCTNSYATEDMKYGCLELLLSHNVNINCFDKHKTSPLMLAASSGYLKIVNRLLLEEGIDYNAQDSEGWNALFYAVSNNRIPVVQRLIDHGMDYTISDDLGRTPRILADERCYKKLSDMLTSLEDAGKSPEELEVMEDYTTMYSNYLKELPDKDGEGGFESDTRHILSTFGYTCSGISFPDFLTMGYRDLNKAGIKIAMKRKLIMKAGIHRYHLFPWNKNSMPPIMARQDWEFCDLIAILGSTVKHLTLIKSSLRYLAKRVKVRRQRGDPNLHKDSVDALISCYVINEQLRVRLERIMKLIRLKVMTYVDEDSVSYPRKKGIFSDSIKYGLIILGATTAGYFMFRCRF